MKTKSSTREQQQRAQQRPDVAEHGAEVGALELGHRHQPEQLEEAPVPPPSADGPRTGAQLERLGRGAHGRLDLRRLDRRARLVDERDQADGGSVPKTTKSRIRGSVEQRLGERVVAVDPAPASRSGPGASRFSSLALIAHALAGGERRSPSRAPRRASSPKPPTSTPSALAITKPKLRAGDLGRAPRTRRGTRARRALLDVVGALAVGARSQASSSRSSAPLGGDRVRRRARRRSCSAKLSRR